MIEDYESTNDYAKRTGMKLRKVQELIKKGDIEAVKAFGVWFIPKGKQQ